MKYLLPLIIIIFLLAPIFVLAQAIYPKNSSECITCETDIPCSCKGEEDVCWSNLCLFADKDKTKPGPCYELYANHQFCALKVCCALTKIQRFMFFIASGLAIIVIVWAGIMYMVAGGEERATKAKKMLFYGLLGAAVVFGSGFIINFLMEILY